MAKTKVKAFCCAITVCSIFFIPACTQKHPSIYQQQSPASCAEHAVWIDKAVVYGVVAPLWGHNGFKTVEQRLGYLKKLGINTIWLWPPVSTRAQGEEYGITDYFSVDPSWGTASDLKRFVEHAHTMNMHVIIDFVPNHTSDKHPFFEDANQYGVRSRYYNFYDRQPNGNVTHYFDYNSLPNLNYNNPQVRNMIINAFEYWVRKYDLDGFRVDMAWAVKERRPDFWHQLRCSLKRTKPDLFLLAEAPARDPNYFKCSFDAAYDWGQGLGQWAWKDAFDNRPHIEQYLIPALTNSSRGYDSNALILRFLNNNDTEDRFVERYGPQVTKVASAMQFTLPGIPLVFAGDEIGAVYLPYSDVNEIPWNDRFDLLQWYEKLIQIRQHYPALRSHEMVVLDADPPSAISYVRPSAYNDPVLVILNFDTAAMVKLPPDPSLKPFMNRVCIDLMQNQKYKLSESLSMPMDANSVRILIPVKE